MPEFTITVPEEQIEIMERFGELVGDDFDVVSFCERTIEVAVEHVEPQLARIEEEEAEE